VLFAGPSFFASCPALAEARLWSGAASQMRAPATGESMPLLTPSDLSDLARYPASLRSAARALWGGGLATARSGPAPRPPENSRLYRK